jgi:dimethylsulfoniopropionate demethylase
MKNFYISKSRRVRSTPFTKKIEEQGVKSYTVYNHMLLPTSFSNVDEEYLHLKKDVQLWDVSVQREIEISGKDAHQLVQLMTCRDLSKSKVGSCYYVPLIDSNGGMVNDPLIYKLEDNIWRVCIADSDVLLYAKGIAAGKKLNVKIFEANIDTLAVQGPKSFKLMEDVFGKEISELKFFKYNFFKFKNNKFLISRSGFSKQGGYEIHVENVKAGLELYDYFFEVGKKYNIKPGAPNHAERIEGGLLSYGNDMLISDNPFECGFEKLVHLNDNVEFIGKDSLKKILKNGIKRKLMGVKINSDTLNLTSVDLLNKKKQIIGNLRSAAFSPTFKKIVGIAMINKEYCKNNEIFNINLNDNLIDGEVCELPII